MLDKKPQFDCPIDRAPLGAWWGRKNVGHSQAIVRDARTTLIETLGEDDTATQMTISCSLRSTDPNIPPNLIPPVVGLLTWGNGGTTSFAEFDFAQGTTVSIAAGAVSLIAALEDPAGEIEVVPSASIGYMPAGGLRAMRTRRFQLTALPDPGSSAIVDIPPFARSVAYERFPQLGFNSVMLDHAGTPIAALSTADPSPRMLIPQSARRIQVINGSDQSESAVTLIFELFI